MFRFHLNSRSRSKKFGPGSLVRDSRGLSSVEYIILLATVVVGCVTLWNKIGGDVHSKLKGARDDVHKIGK